MGRKSRAKHSVKTPTTSAYSNKKEVDRLVQKLLNVCVKPTTRKDEWENYLEIQFLVERIRQFQSSKISPTKDRLKKLPQFEEWLKENEVVLNNIVIEDYGEKFGLGVKATEEIKREGEFLCIPYQIMLTSEKASESYLGEFIKSRKMLSEMPNVCLALYLHCEKYNHDSFYKPYIDILPATYNTTLYFSSKEMEYLKGSSALSVALSQYKSIARQYGIFFNLFHSETIAPEVQLIPVHARNEFTYDAYRWAVSSVSTRLNRIAIMTREEKNALQSQLKEGDKDIKDSTLALIPMWDMLNHSLGQISTDCDPVQKLCRSYAMKDFKKDEQVAIFYGARSNIDFLVYNGFVVEKNPFDRVEFQLGVSPNDKLYKKKVHLLEKLQLKPCGSFHIYAMTDNLPTSPDLLAFLRVFHMDEDDLDAWAAKETFSEKGLKEIYMPHTSTAEADKKVWKFLETRVGLLLRAFERAKEEEELLSSTDVSERIKLAICLRQEAKRVLESCHSFCRTFPLDPKNYQRKPAVEANSIPGSALEDNTIPEAAQFRDFEGSERDTTDCDIKLLSEVAANCAQNKQQTENPEKND